MLYKVKVLVAQSRVTLCNPMDCSDKKNSKFEFFTGLAKKFVQVFLCDLFHNIQCV